MLQALQVIDHGINNQKLLTNQLIVHRNILYYQELPSNITAGELSRILRKLYAEVNKRKYSAACACLVLVGIRAALNRYLVAAPFLAAIKRYQGKNR